MNSPFLPSARRTSHTSDGVRAKHMAQAEPFAGRYSLPADVTGFDSGNLTGQMITYLSKKHHY